MIYLPNSRYVAHRIWPDARVKHFSCCWVARKGSAAAFSLRKTPIDTESLHYTYRRNALAPAIGIQSIAIPFNVSFFITCERGHFTAWRFLRRAGPDPRG